MSKPHPTEQLARISSENFELLGAAGCLVVGRTTFYEMHHNAIRVEVDDDSAVLAFEYVRSGSDLPYQGEMMDKITGRIIPVEEERLQAYAAYMLKCME